MKSSKNILSQRDIIRAALDAGWTSERILFVVRRMIKRKHWRTSEKAAAMASWIEDVELVLKNRLDDGSKSSS